MLFENVNKVTQQSFLHTMLTSHNGYTSANQNTAAKPLNVLNRAKVDCISPKLSFILPPLMTPLVGLFVC